jgi:aspartyl-tRNA(Asn)/glutamyl-tRNA(Gln) amidotransferase subunit A
MKNYPSLQAIQEAIANKETSCENLVSYYLDRIESQKHLNAFLEVFADEAKEQSKLVDAKIANGTAGKLAGMVLAVKDNICIKDHKVSASSKILEGFESLFSATAIQKLLAEDAIIIGRTNCDEFAMGSSNENSAFGPVLNPHGENKVPGGSSGGSAAAVAADLCQAALGSDTGGSIRQPASFCGIVGVKPTYGRISRYGLIAYGSSFDQIGPMCKSVYDAALLTEIMAGKDPMDGTSSSKPVTSYTSKDNGEKKRIAYLSDYFEREGLDPEIKAEVLKTIERLKAEGHTVEAVDFPYLDFLVPTYYVLTTAEASSNLARYDGVHFGYRSENAVGLESTYKNSRTEGFGEEVKRRIMLGTFVLSAGYYDAYFTKGQKVRRLIQDKTNEILSDYDFIIVPTTPGTAFDIDDAAYRADLTKIYLEDIFTAHANLSGNPAISIPLAKHSNGLPYGVQLMANQFEEDKLFAFASELEQNI